MTSRTSLKLGAEELKSLTDTAYEKLKDSILNGTLASGSRLSDRSLSAQMGVSTTTVKRALNMLSIEGLVEIRPRRGTFVIESFSDRMVENTIIRAALEGVVARLAAKKATREEVAAMARQLDEMRKCAGSLSRRDRIEANAVFHGMIRIAAKNPHVARLVEMLNTFDWQLRIKVQSSREEAHRALAEHSEIFRAIESGEEEQADTLMKAHILRSLDFALTLKDQ